MVFGSWGATVPRTLSLHDSGARGKSLKSVNGCCAGMTSPLKPQFHISLQN